MTEGKSPRKFHSSLKLNSPVEFSTLTSEISEIGVLDMSSSQTVQNLFCPGHIRHRDGQLATSMLCAEDENLLKDDLCFNYILQCGKSSEMDCVEKFKELQRFLDSVKKIARPGCSEVVLNVALSLMSNLVEVLSAMTSLQQYPRASL